MFMLGIMFTPCIVFAVEEMTEQEIMEATLSDDSPTKTTHAYINDIEILGANIVKPDLLISNNSSGIVSKHAIAASYS